MKIQSHTAIFPRFLIFLISLVLFQSCTKDKNLEFIEGKSDLEISRLYDINYESDDRNKLDVFLPAGRTSNTPFILLLHGGGWVAGNRQDMHGFQEALLKEGIASASMSYRYASAEVHYPEMMHDVDAALKLCMRQSNQWKIRGSKFVIGGGSAGAHMALLYSYQFDNENSIGGVVSLSGPTDMTDMNWLTNEALEMGLVPAIEKVAGAYLSGHAGILPPGYANSSPIKRLKNVPTLIIHGSKDIVVPYTQAMSLALELRRAHIDANFVTIEGADHDLDFDKPETANHIFNEIADWTRSFSQ